VAFPVVSAICDTCFRVHYVRELVQIDGEPLQMCSGLARAARLNSPRGKDQAIRPWAICRPGSDTGLYRRWRRNPGQVFNADLGVASAMDLGEFLVRSEWPALAGVVIWLLHRPLKRMAEDVFPTKIELWGFKAELEKRLSAVEALMKEHEEFVAKNMPEMARVGLKLVSDTWRRLEAERRHTSGDLSEEDAREWTRLQELKDEFLHHRTSFTYGEVLEFKEDAERLMAHMRAAAG